MRTAFLAVIILVIWARIDWPHPSGIASGSPMGPSFGSLEVGPGNQANDLHTPSSEIKEIKIYDNLYAPSAVLIRAGTTVIWTNEGMHAHTVSSKGTLWDSGPIAPKGKFSVRFMKPGSFEYYCNFHRKEMYGSVQVN